jgi:hypothetical protein
LVVETFWSGGILGLGVLFLTIWGFCKGLSRRHAFVGTLFIVSYLVMRSSWFEMIYTAPFSFLAFALICTQRTATAPYLQRMTQSCLTFSPLLIVCSLVYAVYQKQIGDIYKCSTTETFVGKLAQIQQHPAYFLDRFTGAHRTTYLARAYASALSASELKDLKLSPQEAVQAIDQLAQFLSTQLTPRMSVPAALLGVNFYSELYAEKKVKEAFFENPDIFFHWQKAVVNLLHAAPYRTDILQPYVTFLLQTQQEPSFVPLLHDLLQDHPHNIPALWFLGIIALRHPTLKPLGICLVNKALDHHIERLIPLEKGFIHQLKMAHDPEVSCEKKELDEIFSTFHQEYPSARD